MADRPVNAPALPTVEKHVKATPNPTAPKVEFPTEAGKPSTSGEFRPGAETHPGAVHKVSAPTIPLPKVEMQRQPPPLPPTAGGVQKPGPVYPTAPVPRVILPTRPKQRGIHIEFPAADAEDWTSQCTCLVCRKSETTEFQDIDSFLMRHAHCH